MSFFYLMIYCIASVSNVNKKFKYFKTTHSDFFASIPCKPSQTLQFQEYMEKNKAHKFK